MNYGIFRGHVYGYSVLENGKRGILKKQQIYKGSFYVKYNLSSTLSLCLWYAVDYKSKSFRLILQFRGYKCTETGSQ